MPSTQELTRRIKSVKSTRKVTRAMQMISASKMRKAQAATLASRSYSDYAWELVRSLGGVSLSDGLDAEDLVAQQIASFFQASDSAQKVGVIVISTNRGMVGGFNNNLFIQIRELEKQYPSNSFEFTTLGRKATDIATRLRKNLLADFVKDDSLASVDEVLPLAKLITDKFSSGTYKAVYVVYNKFISTLSQKVEVRQLLPFAFSEAVEEGPAPKTEYIFEPGPKHVLKRLLPRILESQLYQALLENDASEHSARMIMMKNATESASELVADLTLTFNQLRQNKITTELSEITAGKIALEDSN